MKRKIITLLLSLAMVLAYAIPALNTESVVYAADSGTIAQFIQDARWKNGVSWNLDQRPKLSTYDSSGCAAYAADYVRYCHGSNNLRSGVQYTDASQIRNGDVIYVNGKNKKGEWIQHWFVVITRTNGTLYTCEGNSDSAVYITNSKYKVSGSKLTDVYNDTIYFVYGYHYAELKWWETLTPVDIGSSVYGSVTIHNGTKSVSVNANNNDNVGHISDVPATEAERIYSETYKSRFWHYIKNSDGSYRILNSFYEASGSGGRPLEATGTTDYSNVKLGASYTGANTQKWFIYGKGNTEYYFRNAASDLVLWLHPNNNLALRPKNDENASSEKIAIYKQNPVGKSTLTVSATNENANTVFSWTKPTGDVVWYNIKISKIDSSGKEIENKNQDNLLASEYSTLSHRVKLSAGNYMAKIVTHSWANYYWGDAVYFTVEAASSCAHSNTEIKGRVDPTCTTDGYSGDKVCKDCGATISKGSKIAATGHDWSAEYTIDKAATCTEAGSKSKHCKNCGEISDVTAIPATGHNFGEWETIDTGGCDSGGARQHTCNVCGFKETESLNPGGHDWESVYTVDVAATCTSNGSESRHCSRCSATTDSRIIPALGHDYGEWITDSEATCTANGSKHRECSRCGDVITGTIPTSGHEWAADYTVDEKATCTEAGTKSIHCIVCDAVKPGSSVEIPAGAHEFGSWTITKAATCTKDGEQQRECRLCGHTETMTISAQGHEWNEGTIKERPTCTEDGIKTIKCLSCGEEKDDLIPALGHNWDEEYTIDVQATCVEEGQRSIHCLRCDKVQTSSIETIPRKPHNVSAWTTVKEPTCTAEGVREGDCLSCHNKVQEPIPMTDHVWGTDYKVDKAATYGAAGSKSHHCTVCGTIQPGSQVAIARLTVRGTTLQKPKAIKKGFTAKWVKGADVTGYEIQYALNSKFTKSKKTVKVQSASTVSKKIKKLKSKKKYYIRIRTYKVENGNTYYSAWSAKKTVKTK